MNNSSQTQKEALNKFVEALHAYQTATRDMSLALYKLVSNTKTFCEPLSTIIITSNSIDTRSRV